MIAEQVPDLGLEKNQEEKLTIVEAYIEGGLSVPMWTTLIWNHPLVTASLTLERCRFTKIIEESLHELAQYPDWIALPAGSIIWGIDLNEWSGTQSDRDIIIVTQNPQVRDIVYAKKEPFKENVDVVGFVGVKSDFLPNNDNYRYEPPNEFTKLSTTLLPGIDRLTFQIWPMLFSPDSMISGDKAFLLNLRKAFLAGYEDIRPDSDRIDYANRSLRSYLSRHVFGWKEPRIINTPSGGRLSSKTNYRYNELVAISARLSGISPSYLDQWMNKIYSCDGLLASATPSIQDFLEYYKQANYHLTL